MVDKLGNKTGGMTRGQITKATKARRDIVKAIEHPETRAKLGEIIKSEILEPQNADQKKAIEWLQGFMDMLGGLVVQYGPGTKGFDEDKFFKYLRYAVKCAQALAPFQSPTFKAIAVTVGPQTGEAHQRLAAILKEIDKANRDKPLMLSARDGPAKNDTIGPMQ